MTEDHSQQKVLEKIEHLISSHTGLSFENHFRPRIMDGISRRMQAIACPTIDNYWDVLKDPLRSTDEIRAISLELTVGETYFFRHMEQYTALREVALLELSKNRETKSPIKILSAGCSTGEEPYSLAIIARETLGERGFMIIGIDLDTRSIKTAEEGRYSEWSLRATPQEFRKKYFQSDHQTYLIDQNIKKSVTFQIRNLLQPDLTFWKENAFDIIFCRNVFIYFSHNARIAVSNLFSRSLHEGGFLFLGSAENLRGISQEFQLEHSHEAFFYRRKAKSKQVGPRKHLESHHFPSLNESWIRIESNSTARAIRTTSDQNVKGDSKLIIILELLKQDRLKEALEIMGTVSHESWDKDARLLHAVLLTNAGKASKADEICKELLLEDDLNAGAHYLLALCREYAGDVLGAIEHDRLAIYLDPTFSMPHFHLGRLMKRYGDVKSAMREFEYALASLMDEDPSRILLFGGGFQREALSKLFASELRKCRRAS